ncbi:MAG: hyaD 1 [Herminiimonas sp.]|nr:hyaD 1 [Herminiimonas sp.]
MSYERIVDENSEDSLSRIARLITPNSRVLDLGAAAGALGQHLTLQKQCIVDGVEYDPEQASKASTWYRKLQVANLETALLADHFPKNEYDFIICADVVEHLRDPDFLLKQLQEMLAENGRVLLSVPNIGYAGVVSSLISGEFEYEAEGILDSTHVRFFTRNSLLRTLAKNGLRVLSLDAISKDPRHSEFRDFYLDTLSPSTYRDIMARPDALTYQFIVVAAFHGEENVSVPEVQPNRITYGSQVFWRFPEEVFNSQQSRTVAGLIGVELQTLAFELPAMERPPVSLRLDLADRPGYINLHAIRLLDKNGVELWRWDGNISTLSLAQHHDVVFLLPPAYSHCVLLSGDDPYIELPIDLQILKGLIGGSVLEVEMGWPFSADFLVLLEWLGDKKLKNESLNDESDNAKTSSAIMQDQLARISLAEKGALARTSMLRTHVAQLRNENHSLKEKFHDAEKSKLKIQDQLAQELLMVTNLEATRRELLASLQNQLVQISLAEKGALTRTSMLRAHVAQLRSENHILKGKNHTLKEKFHDAEKAKLKAQDQLAQALLAVNNLEAARRELLASTSWRLTMPVRAIGRVLRVGRKLGISTLLLFSNIRRGGTEVAFSKDVMGHLDFPVLNSKVEQSPLIASGWVFSKDSPILSLSMSIDGQPELPLSYGYERPDVAEAFPGYPSAEKSGFMGRGLLRHEKRTCNLQIWATLQNGSRLLCFSRRIKVTAASAKQMSIPATMHFLYGAYKKAWRAYREGRLPLSPSAWFLGMRRYRLSTQDRHQQGFFLRSSGYSGPVLEPYQQWIETNRLSPKLLARMKADAERLSSSAGARISLVVPVYNPPRQFLEEMIASVTSQIYSNWELCLVDDASTLPYVREVLESAAGSDDRIKVKFQPENGHIVRATNAGLEMVTAEYVALLDHDDLLTPDALLHVAECIAKYSDVDWIYTDEDKIGANGQRFDPQFKGAWSPEMAITHNFTHHLTVIRTDLIDKAGGMRTGFEGAQDIDLFLRVAENTESAKIRHIPHICYHWRSHSESTASQGTQKTYVFDSAYRAIQDALDRRGLKAMPFLPPLAKKYGMCLHQLKWKDSLCEGREVTIIIPTKDKADLLKRCISSLQSTVDSRFVKLLVMDDRTTDPRALEYLRQLEKAGPFQCRVIRPKRGDGTFNYARLINEAAEEVDTPYILQLNNDIEATEPGWLEELMGWTTIDDVGVVGARLLYPDHKIQHAGVVIGPHGGLADHQFHHLFDGEVGYLALPHAARNVSAVTGACMLTSTRLFRELNGFDEACFAVEYNDVDFCLRVINKGKRVVYTPQATLLHVTSASRGSDYNPDEHINFVQKYKGFKDPYINENIRMDSMLMAIDGGHFSHAGRLDELKLLVVSHNLNLGGAPIVALEFAKYFARNADCQVTVISPQDGPVRERYEALDIPVRILADFPSLPNKTAEAAQLYFKTLGEDLDLGSFDLVICNTVTTFWGVELARMFGIPSIWHIHESQSPAYYGAGFMEPSMRELFRNSFLTADRVVFQADATRRIYQELEIKPNYVTIPGGLPLASIAEYRQSNRKSTLREKYQIAEDRIVVTIVGTTCERKGQHVFLESIKELETRFPNGIPENVLFVIVGGIAGPYLDMLNKMISRLPSDNVRLFGETKEIYDFYGLSDIFVCASFEESFPMVVLLAMAFELKIVSTNVFGIPEIVSDGHEGILVNSGDSKALADAIHECLVNHDGANKRVRRAYAKIHRLFDNSDILPRHAVLAREVASKGPTTAIQVGVSI